MSPSLVEGFLDRDASVWTPFLERQPGFLGKEAWLPASMPGTVVLIIRWTSQRAWDAVPDDEFAALDDAMGQYKPTTLTCRRLTVRPSSLSGLRSATT